MAATNPRARGGRFGDNGAVSELKDRIRADLTTAMKGRDRETTGTLRMALAAVQEAEVAGASAKELSDDEVQQVLRTEVKRRREAAESYREAGRAQQAEQEDAEAVVLQAYLPQQLSGEELTSAVADAIAEAGVTDLKGMGQAMKAAMAAVAGRADGKAVSAEVRRQLSGG